MDLGAPTLAASYSPLTADHVHGPVEAGVVLAAFSRGFYVGLPGIASVLPVISSDAAALPTAVRLGKRSMRSTGEFAPVTSLRWARAALSSPAR